MKILYYNCPGTEASTLSANLTALGHEVVPLLEGDHSDVFAVCVLLAPMELTDAVSTIGEFRRLLLHRTPMLVLGTWSEPEQVQDLLSAGADDYCPASAEMRAVELRLQVLNHRRLADDDAAELRQRILLQSHHSEAVASITQSIGHDFSNLLAAIQGNADLALLDLRLDARLRQSLEQIEKSARRAAEVTRQIIAFSNYSSQLHQLRPLAINQLIRDTSELLRLSVSRRCRLEQRLGRSLPLIEGDAVPLRQLMLALASALSAAMGHTGGLIQIRTGQTEAEDRAEVALEFDAKPTEASTEDCFAAFFSLQPQWPGNDAVSAIAALHGSHLAVERNDAGGVRVRLAFPVGAMHAAPGPALAGGEHTDAAGATVLLIDDEDSVRVAAERLLRRAGYTVLEASSGEEGLALYQQVGAALDIVVLDLNMPGMECEEVIRRIRDLRPLQRIVVWSGFSEEAATAQLAGISGISFIEKPAQLSDFPLALGRVLAG